MSETIENFRLSIAWVPINIIPITILSHWNIIVKHRDFYLWFTNTQTKMFHVTLYLWDIEMYIGLYRRRLIPYTFRTQSHKWTNILVTEKKTKLCGKPQKVWIWNEWEDDGPWTCGTLNGELKLLQYFIVFAYIYRS